MTDDPSEAGDAAVDAGGGLDVAVDVDDASDDLNDVEPALGDETTDGPLADLVRALRSAAGDDVRSIVRYGADEHRLVYLREDLRDRYDEAARRDRVETLVMKALADPTDDAVLDDYGVLEATLRWFDEAVVAVYPTGDWSGVVVTFDRRRSPLVDVALDHVDSA
jgi:hypothetical protein